MFNPILNESYYSNGMEREVRLLLKEDGDFEPLFDEGYYEKAVICREIVEDVRYMKLITFSESGQCVGFKESRR